MLREAVRARVCSALLGAQGVWPAQVRRQGVFSDGSEEEHEAQDPSTLCFKPAAP